VIKDVIYEKRTLYLSKMNEYDVLAIIIAGGTFNDHIISNSSLQLSFFRSKMQYYFNTSKIYRVNGYSHSFNQKG